MAEWYTRNLEAFYAHDWETLSNVMMGNALKLFPRLRTRRGSNLPPTVVCRL
jgi:hypothetical protein